MLSRGTDFKPCWCSYSTHVSFPFGERYKMYVNKNIWVKVKNSSQKVLSADFSWFTLQFTYTNTRRNWLDLTIVNRAKWLGRLLNVKEANEQAEIYVSRKVLDSALLLLFFSHRLCMNHIIDMLLLVGSMGTRNLILYFVRFCAGSTPKIANKNIQQRTLPSFITISLN